MSRSKSASAQSNATIDARVGADNGAVGVSAQEGDVSVNIVADEAFQLGADAIGFMFDVADRALDVSAQGQKAVSSALESTQQNAKSEAGQLSEQLVKVGIPAVVIGIIATEIFK